jgi:hypothetical protein
VPRPRSTMRKIREILRLSLGEGLSRRQVSAATGSPYSTIADHLARAARAGLGWPLPEDMDDAELEARLFAKAEAPPTELRPLPDWVEVHRELRRKGVTLQLLWMLCRHRHSGSNNGSVMPTAMGTPSPAATTGPGRVGSTWSCARSTVPGRSSSWTSPG